MSGRTYGGPLASVSGAVDLHCHPYPDLFPRLGDDFDIVRAARDAGMKAIAWARGLVEDPRATPAPGGAG